ncbi:SRPBCC family protein [Haematomicrobium sanguinis]|uniref:SRPBCC family protein n=1 Tax=Haematomicrobium sanguinis TaxID=479106 RepID=UPI000479DBB6|nr:SRPBCC family protein [Haematomicrobium sanguinis]
MSKLPAPKDRHAEATRVVAADAVTIFELIADPARQPEWDGNDNLSSADPGQRVHAVGDIFAMTNTSGKTRDNHIFEFEEGRLIAWKPAPQGGDAPGHVWRWKLEPLDDGTTRVTHTYDWSRLRDEARFERAMQNTPEALGRSIDRLAALAERTASTGE